MLLKPKCSLVNQGECKPDKDNSKVPTVVLTINYMQLTFLLSTFYLYILQTVN